jgi:hypothetical protein
MRELIEMIRDYLYVHYLNWSCRAEGGHLTPDDDTMLCDRCGPLDDKGIPIPLPRPPRKKHGR